MEGGRAGGEGREGGREAESSWPRKLMWDPGLPSCYHSGQQRTNQPRVNYDRELSSGRQTRDLRTPEPSEILMWSFSAWRTLDQQLSGLCV